MVFDGIPANEKAVSRWTFDRSVKFQTAAAFGLFEMWNGLGYSRFERSFFARPNINFGDFINHDLMAPLRDEAPP